MAFFKNLCKYMLNPVYMPSFFYSKLLFVKSDPSTRAGTKLKFEGRHHNLNSSLDFSHHDSIVPQAPFSFNTLPPTVIIQPRKFKRMRSSVPQSGPGPEPEGRCRSCFFILISLHKHANTSGRAFLDPEGLGVSRVAARAYSGGRVT